MVATLKVKLNKDEMEEVEKYKYLGVGGTMEGESDG